MGSSNVLTSKDFKGNKSQSCYKEIETNYWFPQIFCKNTSPLTIGQKCDLSRSFLPLISKVGDHLPSILACLLSLIVSEDSFRSLPKGKALAQANVALAGCLLYFNDLKSFAFGWYLISTGTIKASTYIMMLIVKLWYGCLLIDFVFCSVLIVIIWW